MYSRRAADGYRVQRFLGEEGRVQVIVGSIEKVTVEQNLERVSCVTIPFQAGRTAQRKVSLL